MLGSIARVGYEFPGIKKKRSHVCCGEACGKPSGGRLQVMDVHGSLKPYWGNLAVRDYRGDGGNLTLDQEGVTKLLLS